MAKAKKPVLQPEINIGLVGHVDHGKTTLTKALSGKWTDTHSEELKQGITIRLGYADTVFVKTKDKKFATEAQAKKDKAEFDILRKISLVDAPGHESLMATMLSGATIIDGAILLVAANETCPQPQTREHLMALQISGIKNVVVVQNKVDIVSEEKAKENYEEIKAFLKGTDYEKSSIIPISAQHNVNIDVLIELLEKELPTPKRDDKADPIFLIARSFDINKPGTLAKDYLGGVLGGALLQGKLKVGDKIQLKPGRDLEEKNHKVYKPINAKITGLITGGKPVDQITPGGSVGIMTSLDPSIVKSDKLTGSIAGLPDKLPQVWDSLKIKTHLLDRVVGSKEDLVVEPIKKLEPLMLNINAAATVGVVTELHKDSFSCKLKLPICANPGSRITISRRLGNRFRLIGYGLIE